MTSFYHVSDLRYMCLLAHTLCSTFPCVLAHIRRIVKTLNEVTSCVENAKYSAHTKELNITMAGLKIARWETKQAAQANLPVTWG